MQVSSPKGIGGNGNFGGAALFLIGEPASDGDRRLDGCHQPTVSAQASDGLAALRASPHQIFAVAAGGRGEAGEPLPILEAQAVAAQEVATFGFLYVVQLFGVRQSDRFPHDGVGDREQRGDGADTDGERSDGRGGKHGALPESAPGLAGVSHPVLESDEDVGVAGFLLPFRGIAELAAGLPAGFVRPHAVGDQLRHALVDVELDFCLDVLVSCECAAEACEESHGG